MKEIVAIIRVVFFLNKSQYSNNLNYINNINYTHKKLAIDCNNQIKNLVNVKKKFIKKINKKKIFL